MATSRDTRVDEGENFLEGKLLIAMPGMADGALRSDVIYMCCPFLQSCHGDRHHKPVPGLSFSEMMKQLQIEPSPCRELPILYGGPVETGRASYCTAATTTAAIRRFRCRMTIAHRDARILLAIAGGRGPKHALFALGFPAGARAK